MCVERRDAFVLCTGWFDLRDKIDASPFQMGGGLINSTLFRRTRAGELFLRCREPRIASRFSLGRALQLRAHPGRKGAPRPASYTAPGDAIPLSRERAWC